MSRLNIIRAIRDLAEPPRRRRGRAGWVVGGCSLAAAGVARRCRAAGRDGFALLLGPTLVVVGLAPLAARFLPAGDRQHGRRAARRRAGARRSSASFPPRPKGASVMLYVVQGIVLTAAAVTLLSFQQERVSRASCAS